jgi:hypothetical protein
MSSGLCPKCGTTVSSAIQEPITIKGHRRAEPKYRGVSYVCPFCGCVLSVGIDPSVLRSEIAAQVLAGLRRD